MNLVEIKNSLAKLYYQPVDFPLVLSDFLTIDDKNQKILSQVVSLESTNKEDTNCAILKFSLDINDDNTFAVYSGYVPSLDASVSMTSPQILNSIFSNKSNSLSIGQMTNSSNLLLNVDSAVLDKFLYIQSDKFEETKKLQKKILSFNSLKEKSTLVIDFEDITEYENATVLELGKDFKLPVNNETLNYIYEHDLTGLTVEQKTIVQDIILEIQDYINTLQSGFIPFKTLIEVVNDIYQTDKSVGIILLRNKLIKYHQYSIFASTKDEFESLNKAIAENSVVALKVKNSTINEKWQKETLDFVLDSVKNDVYLMLEMQDNICDKELINKIYKLKNFKPIAISGYDFILANQLKSFAKNLVLFKPEEHQKAFATYNSFLNKLGAEEFIISGETTFYTPLIVKPCEEITVAEEITETQDSSEIEVIVPEENIQDDFQELLTQSEEEEITIEDIEPLDELMPIEQDETNELKNIFEESLEQEIAKDVDGILYSSQEEEIESEPEPEEEISYKDMFSDEDLDMLDDLNLEKEEIVVNITENDSIPSIPIYKADTNENLRPDGNIKIAEGNIVYHEKYGRGVVEQLISYGKKTLCSIQFDNVGRRLLDPNLADLKQM